MLKLTIKSFSTSMIALALLASCSYIKKDSKCGANCSSAKGNYKEENKLAPKDAKSENAENKADANKTGEKKLKKRVKKAKVETPATPATPATPTEKPADAKAEKAVKKAN
jgi:hypothetical protein